MAGYAIASHCGGTGWVVAITSGSAPSSCSPISGNRHCCPDAVARTFTGGSSLPRASEAASEVESTTGSWAAYTPGTPAAESILTSAADWASSAWSGVTGKTADAIPGLETAIDAGIQQGAAELGLEDVVSGIVEPSWLQRNWPWLVTGGLAAGVLALVAVGWAARKHAPQAV